MMLSEVSPSQKDKWDRGIPLPWGAESELWGSKKNASCRGPLRNGRSPAGAPLPLARRLSLPAAPGGRDPSASRARFPQRLGRAPCFRGGLREPPPPPLLSPPFFSSGSSRPLQRPRGPKDGAGRKVCAKLMKRLPGDSGSYMRYETKYQDI
ncbi:putative uncharacterized protein UNQ6190/PRO20217 [Pongo pygmaeus]|uniref:putative uncharacterized protein UNQ6190/PRO20217 n=1 Tax=Pongo pygmaeus TaxID=9600 RepID=UPI00300C4A7E